MPKRQITLVIHKDAANDSGVTLANFPATCGRSTTEPALANAGARLSEVVADCLQNGSLLPDPIATPNFPANWRKGATLVAHISIMLPDNN